METAQSLCKLHDLRIEITGCSCYVLAGSLRLSQIPTTIFGPNYYLKSCVVLAISVRWPYRDPAMCLRATGLQFFKICHSVELN